MTTYKILVADKAPFSWLQVNGEYEGANDEAAIKAMLLTSDGTSDPSGEYVAVPVRSFKPRKVEAKQAYSFS